MHLICILISTANNSNIFTADTFGDLLQLLPIEHVETFHILPHLHLNELYIFRVKIGAEFRFRATPPKPLDGFRRLLDP
jgi:hypothetical protein